MTDLGRHLTEEDLAMIRSMTKGGGEKKERTSSGGSGGSRGGMPGYTTIAQGAATSVWAATAPELEGLIDVVRRFVRTA